jgi:hypothetical protein
MNCVISERWPLFNFHTKLDLKKNTTLYSTTLVWSDSSYCMCLSNVVHVTEMSRCSLYFLICSGVSDVSCKFHFQLRNFIGISFSLMNLLTSFVVAQNNLLSERYGSQPQVTWTNQSVMTLAMRWTIGKVTHPEWLWVSPASSIHTRGPFPGRKSVRAHTKHRLYCCVRISCRGNVFTEPLTSNGCLFRHHYRGFQKLVEGATCADTVRCDLIILLILTYFPYFEKK